MKNEGQGRADTDRRVTRRGLCESSALPQMTYIPLQSFIIPQDPEEQMSQGQLDPSQGGRRGRDGLSLKPKGDLTKKPKTSPGV